MADNVLRHLFTGFVRLHILYHAEQEPICGVEIMAELRRHGYDLGPGTLYPILHQLEDSRYLSSEEVVVGGKRRKNFRITRRGRKLLGEARQKLRELAGEVL
ncbi:MAG: PadR family transcriptional regulator [Deltaproteobacteria bacterium]